MFRQPYTIKRDVILKFTERKILKDSVILDVGMKEQDFFELFTKRTLIHCVTVVVHNGSTVSLYLINKTPYFFKHDNKFYPTVFLLWKFPNTVPYLTVTRPVLSYLSSGADLMLPGVVTPPRTTGLAQFPTVQENDTVFINIKENIAAYAVGYTLMGTEELISARGRGKCVKVLHCYGDRLCNFDHLKTPYPELGPVMWTQLPSQTDYNEAFPPLGGSSSNKPSSSGDALKNLATNGNTEALPDTDNKDMEDNACASLVAQQEETDSDEDLTETEKMDKLLVHCFYVAIKYDKRYTLPILTSTFFKNHILFHCPEGKSLDMKKTTYKKLKTFLDCMRDLGVINTSEQTKGVESIIAINKEHPSFGAFYIKPDIRPKTEEQEALPTNYYEESFMVTGSVLPIFSEAHFGRGDVLPASTIRNVVTAYVKNHNLQDKENKRLVSMDDLLRKLCRTEVPITWEELIEKIINCMTSCLKVTSGSEYKIAKGHANILLSIENRSGNKKVTIVDNLDLYGVNIQEFAKACQHGAAASTSITKPPNKKCEQLLVQGNHVALVHNILTTKYRIPKKFISGLENAPKRK